MNKWLVLFLMGFFMSSLVSLDTPAIAQEGTATLSMDQLNALANRKSYRLGLRVSGISPSSSTLTSSNMGYDFTFEFDAKLNENLDLGPRGGYASYKATTSDGIDGTYGMMKFGFGGRLYMVYWGDYGSTHGFFNSYFDFEADYYNANKGSGVSTSPSSFSGIGGYGALGLELAFGPNATGFASVGYQRTSIKSSTNVELPLSGFVAQAGTRLAFF
jgi:hypothetical protein